MLHWLSVLLGSTDVLADIIALVGIGLGILSFFGTILAVVISVAISLWIQRRDFDQRADELRAGNEAARVLSQDEFRRHIIEEAFGIVADASLSIGKNLELADQWLIRQRVDALGALLRIDSGTDGDFIAEWFRVRVLDIAETVKVPATGFYQRFEKHAKEIHDGFTAWYANELSARDFAEIPGPEPRTKVD